jgi:glycosyltransferase involved in cell wall biosynthesis
MKSYIERKGAELIAAHAPELIVSHDYGWFYNGLGSAALSRAHGVPYVSEIHHVPGHPRAADLRERRDKLVARAYIRWARRRALAFRVVNATEMPALLKRWGVPERMIVVLPSLYIDLDVFRPTEPAPEPEQDLVFVGRLVNNKGLDRIVEALELLARSGKRLRALFVGKGPLAGELRALVRRRGLEESTRFLEWVDTPADLAEIYRTSRVAVCASTCEGGPRVTVEAMACGTPVVSTPVGMMTELLADGAAGLLCEFTSEGLAAALRSALSDEPRRQAMGAEAHRRAQRFEYARTLRGYADGLKQLVGAGAAV